MSPIDTALLGERVECKTHALLVVFTLMNLSLEIFFILPEEGSLRYSELYNDPGPASPIPNLGSHHIFVRGKKCGVGEKKPHA